MMRGSIRELDGAWGFRIDLGLDPATGKRRQVSKQGFTTKRDAEAALRELSQSVDSGTLAKRSARTLGAERLGLIAGRVTPYILAAHWRNGRDRAKCQ